MSLTRDALAVLIGNFVIVDLHDFLGPISVLIRIKNRGGVRKYS